MTTLWQLKDRNCCFVIEPHGSYELIKSMFVYYYLNKLNISSSKFWVQDLQRLVVEQPIQSGYFFMKFISDVSKDIILISQQEPFLMVTRLHIPS